MLGAAHIQDAQDITMRTVINSGLRRVNPSRWVSRAHFDALKKQKQEGKYNELGADMPAPEGMLESGQMPKADIIGVSPNEMMPTIQYLDESGQRTVMVSENQRNTITGSTAMEASIVAENSTKINGILIERMAESIVRLGTIIHWMCRHHQREESLINLWNEVNGDSGITLEQAMAGNYTFEANGLSANASKIVRSENAIKKFGILSQVPEVMNVPERKWKLLYDTLQDGSSDRSPEDTLGTLEEWEQKSLKQQEQAQLMLAQQQQVEQQPADDKLMLEMMKREDANSQHQDTVGLEMAKMSMPKAVPDGRKKVKA